MGPESVVALCVGRGTEMVAGMLATWLAGGGYLPLDPGYPAGRLGFMLADSGARVLVGDRAAAAVLGRDLPAGVAGVWLDDPATAAGIAAAEPGTPVPVAAGQLAYVIYTSGSTGRPKGVQVPHGGVVNLVAGQGPVFAMAEDITVVQFASFSFDAAVSEVCLTLASGGRLVIASDADRAEPARLAGLVRAARAGLVTLPPSVAGLLDPAEVAGLGTLVLAGERADATLARRWAGQVRLVNAYGPTETTVCATAGPAPAGAATVPIGQPIANTRAYVLDSHLNPVPAGVTGELFVGGAQLARGYGNRPALTAERFIPDPFAGDGGRLYRTGDLARWRLGGVLEFAGRADEQVKLRGFRIEPGEVETALAAHPGVATAVVAVFGEHDQARLAAYLVPENPDAGIPLTGELRDFLAERLPEFMIPAVFTGLESLPLTPNGKLDRARATRP